MRDQMAAEAETALTLRTQKLCRAVPCNAAAATIWYVDAAALPLFDSSPVQREMSYLSSAVWSQCRSQGRRSMPANSNKVAITSIYANKNTSATWDTVQKAGRQPVLISVDGNRERIRTELGEAAAQDAVYVPSLDDPIALAGALPAALRAKQIELSHWINTNDPLTPAFLHTLEQMGMTFDFLEPYASCRIKPIARRIAYKAGCSTFDAQVEQLDKPSRLPKRAQGHVVKPICGSASKGVKWIRNAESWQKYCDEQLAKQLKIAFDTNICIRGFRPYREVLVEPYLRSEEWEIDGFASGGTITICAAGYKFHDYSEELGFRELGCVIHRFNRARSAHEVATDRAIESWTNDLLGALRFTSGAFHIEAIQSGGALEMLEVNPRPGGGSVPAMIAKLTGVDLNRQCTRLWIGCSADQQPARQQHEMLLNVIVYPTQNGYIKEISNDQELFVLLDGERYLSSWFRQASRGDPVSTENGEQYLGELHLYGADVPSQDLARVSRALSNWLVDEGFVVISPERPKTETGAA